nr:MAP3K epsilon protein kinase 1-like isoform X1 [Tanacetum cinerariifolium]
MAKDNGIASNVVLVFVGPGSFAFFLTCSYSNVAVSPKSRLGASFESKSDDGSFTVVDTTSTGSKNITVVDAVVVDAVVVDSCSFAFFGGNLSFALILVNVKGMFSNIESANLTNYCQFLKKSSRINTTLAVNGLTPLLISRLDHQDAIARLNLLKLIKAVYEHHPRPKQLIVENDLPQKLQNLIEERRDGQSSGGQVLVKQMATSLLKALHINTVL